MKTVNRAGAGFDDNVKVVKLRTLRTAKSAAPERQRREGSFVAALLWMTA